MMACDDRNCRACSGDLNRCIWRMLHRLGMAQGFAVGLHHLDNAERFPALVRSLATPVPPMRPGCPAYPGVLRRSERRGCGYRGTAQVGAALSNRARSSGRRRTVT
jgi:hypothetical protein